MFVEVVRPSTTTKEGKLVKILRQAEKDIQQFSDYKLRILERPGAMLIDLLSSNDNEFNCRRASCLFCKSKINNHKLKKPCTKKNIVYNVKCLECWDQEVLNNDSKPEAERKKKSDLREVLYVGESSKGMALRSHWHAQKFAQCNKSSFMMKHVMKYHEGMEESDTHSAGK